MPLVIDGNNLLYAARAAGTSSLLLGRAMLCNAIGRWAQQRRETVRIVFDGPQPSAARVQQIEHAAVDVVFSGAGVSADTVLTELIESDSAARRLVVVSSDKEIVRVAKRRRARPVRSEDFWLKLTADLGRGARRGKREPEEKEAGLAPDATDEWLEEFGLE